MPELLTETQKAQKSSLGDWRRRLKWRLFTYRLEVVATRGGAKLRPRTVSVYAPFAEDAQVGSGNSPDEIVKTVLPSSIARIAASRKVGREELADFLEAMGSAIESGASEGEALRLGATSCRSPRLRGTVAGLFAMVQRGVSLSDAMSLFPDTFSPMLIALTRASESAGGKKGEVFTALALKMHNDNKLMRKFVGAMMYPMVVLVMAVAVSIVLQIKALPPMVDTFKEMGAKIPWITQQFYDASTFMKHYWWLIFGGGALIVYLLIKYTGTIARTPFMQRLLLRLPLCGAIMRGLCMSRALNAYCMLKSAGAPDAEIYQLAGSASGNVVYRELFAAVYARISKGEPPEDAFMRERHRAGDEGQRVASKLRVGAFSGDTVPLLQRAANEMQEKTEMRLAMLPQALELPLLAICGSIVGSIVLAIFLPYPSLIIDVLNKQNH